MLTKKDIIAEAKKTEICRYRLYKRRTFCISEGFAADASGRIRLG